MDVYRTPDVSDPRLLYDLADSEAVLAQVVAAMRVYERDVLKQVTFREREARE